MANMNIFGKDWLNIVFDGRNQEYGAYKLRKENGKNTITALILGIAVIGGAFGSKYLYDEVYGTTVSKVKDEDEVLVTEIVLPEEVTPPEPEVIEEPLPEPEPKPQSDASKNVQDEIEFKETIVKKDSEVKREQKAAQSDFNDNTNSGQQDREGDKDKGDLKINGENTGGADKGSKGIGQGDVKGDEKVEDPNKIYVGGLEAKAVMPSGWQQKFMNQFRMPDLPSNVDKITIRLQFVVEKDGSLTDIKVLNDQYGLAKEAERVLKSLPKWTPAKAAGGKTVRSKFTQPVTIKVN